MVTMADEYVARAAHRAHRRRTMWSDLCGLAVQARLFDEPRFGAGVMVALACGSALLVIGAAFAVMLP